MPQISVIMSIYNTKKKEYLERSLSSLLKQTYKDFELIICDDGSTNDCLKWAKEICKNDSRVKFIYNKENRGLAYSLNKCLKEAKGYYIARMDDDDESSLNRFEIQINYLKKHKNISLVSSNINLFDDNGIYAENKFPEIIKKKDFLFNSPIVHPAIMAKREAFNIVSGYNEEDYAIRVEDYDLFMRMFSANIKMAVIQEKLLNYRLDLDNMFRRKKYKYRINEAKIRYQGFKKLELFPIGIVYIIKPLIVGLLPLKIIKKIRKR